ncbi:hypothetical protein D3C77_292770 [compost metagenome]
MLIKRNSGIIAQHPAAKQQHDGDLNNAYKEATQEISCGNLPRSDRRAEYASHRAPTAIFDDLRH